MVRSSDVAVAQRLRLHRLAKDLWYSLEISIIEKIILYIGGTQCRSQVLEWALLRLVDGGG